MTNERFSENQKEVFCKELVELVTDYIEGAMPLGLRIRFDEHFAECEGCQIYLNQMRQTIQLTGTLREETILESGRNKLLQAFRDWKKAQV